jgi:hypothetical protein
MAKVLLFIALSLVAAQVVSADEACNQQCWANYYDCPCFDYWSCAYCDDQINSCLSYCSTCPSTRNYTTTTVVSRQSTGRNGCYEDHIYLNVGRRYAEYFTTQRLDTYRETTNCNGTKTTTLLSSTNSSYYCWVRDAIASCSPFVTPNFLRICQ